MFRQTNVLNQSKNSQHTISIDHRPRHTQLYIFVYYEITVNYVDSRPQAWIIESCCC